MKKNILEINQQGFTILKNIFTKKSCDNYIKKIEKIVKLRIKKKNYIGNNEYTIVHNFFSYEKSLLDLIAIKKIDKILKYFIDDDYVLISSSARNRSLNNFNIKKLKATGGVGWHTDTRYINKKKITPSLRYLVIIALDEFRLNNAPTLIVPKSHKLNHKPSRDKYYFKQKPLLMKKGSIAILDSALWHKAGESTDIRRWAIFSSYGPWFFKPYFQFHKIMQNKLLNKFQKKLLHFNSIPPEKFNTEKIATLKKY